MELHNRIHPYISLLHLQTIISISFFLKRLLYTSYSNPFSAPQPCFTSPPINTPIFSTSPFFLFVIEYYPYLTFIIPINTMTIIVNNTAPNSPNMNQPITNAITEPKPIPNLLLLPVLITLRFG